MMEKAVNTAGLSPEQKRSLLARLMGGRGREYKPLPLSFAQQRMWFMEQLEPGTSAYSIRLGFRLEGRLDHDALRASLDELVRRHESLRTVFSSVGGQPVQLVLPAHPASFTEIDLTGLSEAERDAAAEELAAREARRTFDLRKGPLFRVALLRLGEDAHNLLLTMHHIVSDGLSMELFYRELTALYEAFIAGSPSPLEEPSIQYADFARWQRDWLSGDVLEEHLDYWKRNLAGAPALLELPTDRPRPAAQSYRGRKQTLQLRGETAERLKALCARAGVTNFMALLAAFKTLLYRYSGQDDVVVGTPVANRNRAEVEDVIGPLVNTLALRSDLSGDPTFAELLARVRQTALGAYSHQGMPFDVLLEHLSVKRDLSFNPVFQVMFGVHTPPANPLRLPGVEARRIRMSAETTKFDLNLTVTDTGRGLWASLEYNTDLFDDSTAGRILRHFDTLLASACAQPRTALSRLALLDDAERRQLLAGWNDTAEDYEGPTCIHSLFERQARRTPDRVAVSFDGAQLTYAELDAKAEEVAARLVQEGIEAEDRVAVCLERSLEMVVAVLGVLKSGAAYLPLDPAYPPQRLGFMLEDSGARLVLTQESLNGLLPAHGAKVLCVDSYLVAAAGNGERGAATPIAPESLAYVLYTSGSTGNPKGVQIEHRSVVNFLNSMRGLTGVSESDTLLAVTTLSFDIAGLELYLPLTVGARLEVASRDEAADGTALAARMSAAGATVMQATPATWRMLLQSGWAGDTSLRILCGGEALPQELAGELVKAGASVLNLYGPTETTIWSSTDAVEAGSQVTIGRPIANTKFFILDAELQPVPPGVEGDVYIAGSGLARGYLRRGDLTAYAFVPEPHTAEAGARMYRTGDRGRYRADGRIKYEGRGDGQVKVRGYRIELGEIEGALNQLDAVAQGVVAVREDEAGEKRLVAYVVCEQTAAPKVSELREHLRQRLPDYMIPSRFVLMQSLPLTPNGKVDRRALPEPDSDDSVREGQYVAPSTAVEEILAGIWSEVLKTERVGASDNFFELGGHSLLATQVVSRIRQAFQTEIPLRTLFESPTVAELAARIESFASEEVGGTSSLPPVVPAPREGQLPTSFSQTREWFLQRLESESYTYNIPAAVGLKGSLVFEALRQGIGEVVRRHESLRTNFVESDGQPVQVIRPSLNVEIPFVDLTGLPEFARKAATRRLAKAEAARPFDLAGDPLVRVRLLKTSEDNHVVLLTMHHIVSDGWSRGVFVRELEALYEAFARGCASPLEEPTIQYADFACWQRRWLDGPALDPQLEYWKRKLAGSPAVLELPTDRPRPAVKSYKGATETFTINESLVRRLRELSRRNAVTLYMTLLGAFDVLLSRYSNQTDVLVGSYIANRNRRELEGLIGFFVNTLVMRTDMSGDPTFKELLARVRKVTVEAFAHQDVPFEKVLESMQVERSRSHTPLFQAMLVHQNAPEGRLRLPGLDSTPLNSGRGRANFDLTLVFAQKGEELEGVLEYSTDLFDQATAARILVHFENILESAAEDPDQKISALPLSDDAERRQLLVEWSGARARRESAETCAHEMFEAQAARTPDAVAVEHESDRLTYAELNRSANRLAHYLRRRGVGPDEVVGVCLERSVEMVVGILAVLKAGGAYVALDPAYPAARIAYMAADSGARFVITRREFADALEGQAGVSRVLLDVERGAIARESAENPAPTAAPENLAYVIYTSGSTGKPKGVMVEHRSLCAYTETAAGQYRISSGDRVLQFASINFDASAEEIYPALARGAALVLRTDSMIASAAAFLEECRALELSVVDLPTAYWHELTEEMSAESLSAPPSLRLVIIGGEKAVAERLRAWRNVAGERARIVNTYGPTEATIVATKWEPEPSEPTPSDVPIGRAVDNAEVYVLDRAGQPAPAGVRGELHIGGAGVVRGYLRRPELTAERFTPDPFGLEAGARLYRSGDLVRFLADGNLEYAGRADDQVKVRGFRIELGEIESALLQHVAVREAAALVTESEPGDKKLTAYLVINEETAFSVSELRGELKKHLPDYMIPTAFVKLDAMPLTVSGKIDRRALTHASGARLDSGEEYTAPRTAVEELLAGIWADLLGAEEVGASDNFFDLGGHSLLATQVVSRIRQAFGVEIPLRAVFDSPTVAGLAAVIDDALTSTEPRAVPAVEPAPRGGELSLSSAQERLWFLQSLTPESSAYNIPWATRLTGRLEVAALEQTLSEIVRRHEVLRTSFAESEGRPRQVISARSDLSLAVVGLEGLGKTEREREVKKLASSEAARPFDLTSGPVMRARLLRLSPTEHVLLLTIHHIASDGWSTGILVRELVTLYAAFGEGVASALEELPVQYADYAQWQRGLLDGEALDPQLEYWKKRLGGELPVLELPTDRPRPAVLSDRGAVRSVSVSKKTSEALKRLSRAEGATLFMTLTAAFKLLLSRYSGQTDIVIGTPIAGRNRAETENLIGFFINMLVLRTDLSGDPTFKQLMARERETALEGHLNQDVPFERLVEELQPGRDASRTPLFQVMFALQNTRKEGLRLAGLRMSPVGSEVKTVHFELSLALAETEHGLRGAVEYSTDLFDGERVARMMEHFTNLLDAVAEDAGRRLSELPMLADAETRQLLQGWNETAAEHEGAGRCAHELVAGQARRAPDSLAVSFGEEQLTFGELNARANRLANYLRRRGVGPESIVGVCARRGVEMVASVLGVMKSGAAYLPLDPAYPAQRLGYMLTDARAAALVGHSELTAPVAESASSGLTLVDVDALGAEIEAESAEDFESGAGVQNLAYVIYTSGSTGTPKGIGVSHEGLGNLVGWHRRAFRVTARDRATQMAGMSFDASVWELWPYLTAGASVHVVDDETRAVPAKLRDWLTENSITKTFLPTPLAEGVITLDWPRSTSLELMLTGGDKLHGRPAQGRLPFGLINNYGPSESSVVSTSGAVSTDAADGEAPDIGRPVDNTRVFIVNAGGLAPTGASGELYVGGRSLARGYVNRPELTAERFVPDAFSSREGERVYRTGDVARYKRTGEIEYVGRADDQVKVRGYRIELREIETVLSRHEAVSECAVLALDEGAGGKRLVAYVASSADARPKAAELREHLKQRLPDYMVPAAFVLMESLPLTPNGKVDRRSLPAPDSTNSERDGGYVAPRTAVEEIVAGVWSEVLKEERVGASDNFFELGGHSLLATQVVSRIRQALGVEISLRSLFDSPTVAGLASHVETAMSSERAQEVPAVEPVERGGRLRLSSAQERLWFIENLRPGGSAYNVPWPVTLRGALDVAALEQGLSEILRRHEVLRTSFGVERGRPVQVIGAARPLRLAVVDLEALAADERQRRARRLAASESARPFDLTTGPVLRARLLRLSNDEHVLLLTLHHIASDGWSTGILVRELGKLYESFSAGSASPLAELRVQYADYAEWQRTLLEGDVLERQLGYWRGKLGGPLPALEMPTDKTRPAILSDRGARVPLVVPKETSDALKAMSRAEGVTLFMTLAAAFRVLLSRYSGQKDVIIGTPIAGRNRTETENLIGFFVNTLALRTDLSGEPTFKELVARERETALEAYLNQDVPFERLVEELHPDRDMSRSPVFQALFALQNAPHEAAELSGIELSPFKAEVGTAHFELSLALGESAQGIKGVLEYSTDLYERETVERMAAHFVNLLGAAASDAGRKVAELPLMGDDERREVLVGWNDTARDYAPEGFIHEMFERQAAQTPDRVALVYEGGHLTYSELNARANKLGRRLRASGVGPDVVVGVMMERSVEMVLSLYGVLKAGGAYLPLDPENPAQRLLSVLEEAAPPVVLTQEHLLRKLPQTGAKVVALDSGWAQIEDESAAALPTLVSGENLAYVIYTSGSTGKPKGAMLPHSGILNRLQWMQEQYGLTDWDVVVQKTPFGFDVSVWEFFWPLMFGARLVVARPQGHKDGGYLARLMREERVSVVHFVPSMLQAMLQAGGLESCDALRQVVCSGEALAHDLQERFFGVSGAALDNLYGPTEASVDVTWWACERGDGRKSVPIGRPIANTQMYVLGEGGSAVPAGVCGELHIGGVGLGRGYLNRPDLTAERFVPEAHGASGGGRLYRTGDVARYLRDGSIEYIGRMDSQVKIRGNRVELGEIEAALREHPAVEEAAVVVRGEGAAEKELVGYVVGREGPGPRADELRRYLRERIPVYMIPSALVALEALPLLSNGKVDRNALGALGRPRPASEVAYVAPRTALEQTITNVWMKVLDLKKCGINDNFFDLGGSSLTLIRACYELKEKLDTEISIIEMFEYPTIGELAGHLGNKNGRDQLLQQVQDRAGKQKQAMMRRRRAKLEA